MPFEKIIFTPNVTQQVALKFADGRVVEGRFGDQMYYTLTDGRAMYLDMGVAAKINGLEPAVGELFNICKRWSGKKTESPVWEVWPAVEGEVKQQPAPRVAAGAGVSAPAPVQAAKITALTHNSGNHTTAVNGVNGSAASKTKLEDALKTAVAAVAAAQVFARELGLTVAFTTEDIRAMAITLVIGGAR
jgi:hypothetical protein